MILSRLYCWDAGNGRRQICQNSVSGSFVQSEPILLVLFCLSFQLLSKGVMKFRRRHVNSKAYSVELLSSFKVMCLYTGHGYCLPPMEIQEIVDLPPNPSYYISPRRGRIMFLKRRAMASLSEQHL